jgi:hypothetical protein
MPNPIHFLQYCCFFLAYHLLLVLLLLLQLATWQFGSIASLGPPSSSTPLSAANSQPPRLNHPLLQIRYKSSTMLPKTNPERKSDNYPFLVPILSVNPKFQKLFTNPQTQRDQERAQESEEERPPSLRSFFFHFIIFFGNSKWSIEHGDFSFFIFLEFLEIFWFHAVFPLVYCEKKTKK